jgi:hypothetical protein
MTSPEQADLRSGSGPADLGGPLRASADWLHLRRAADTQARDRGGGGLLDRLVAHLHARGAERLRLIDLGAGTGANRAYLEPRLPFPQSWVAVDHDQALLDHDDHGESQRIQAGVRDLSRVLRRFPGSELAPTVLTCTAVLDVLTLRDISDLAEAVVASNAPALLSLTVTGLVSWSPADEGDRLVDAAFNAHQQRHGRAGGAAVPALVSNLRSRGASVVTVSTPWVLDSGHPELLTRWLRERVAAAVEQCPEDVPKLEDWLTRREGQVKAGDLVVRVDHQDLLVLPA